MEQSSLLRPLSPPAPAGPNLHAVSPDQGRVWRFRIDGHPEPQGSMKGTLNNKTGRVVVFASNDKVLKSWREQIALTAQALRPRWLREPIDEPVAIALTFVRARGDDYLADGHTLRKGARRFPATFPDIDKLSRAVLDGLADARIYVDDGRVVSLIATKRFAERGEGEGVEVELSVL